MRLSQILAIAAGLVAAGCVSGAGDDGLAQADDENDGGADGAAGFAADLWGGADRLPLVAWDSEGGWQFDVLCRFGGVGPIERSEDGGVYAGATAVEFTISDSPGRAMMQLGYSIDDSEVTWFPIAGPSGGSWRADVAPDQTETPGEERWVFHYRMNTPEPADQDCYTGIGAGPMTMRIDAVRG